TSRPWLDGRMSLWQCSARHVCQETFLAYAPPARGEVRGCVGRMRLADHSSGTQTPTATPEGGRLHDSLCLWSSPQWGLHHPASREAPSAPPSSRQSQPRVRRSITADLSVASSQEQSSSASLHAPYGQRAQALTPSCPALR